MRQRLEDCLKDLRALRGRFCADLPLTAGLGLTVLWLRKWLESGADGEPGVLTARLVEIASASGEPMEVCGRFMRTLALSEPLADAVAVQAAEHRGEAKALITSALDASTLAEHLFTLYMALVPAAQSEIGYHVLADHGPAAGRELAARQASRAREIITRLIYPQCVQVRDLDGHREWELHGEATRATIAKHGPSGAERACDDALTHLLYPRTVAMDLVLAAIGGAK